jgi:hypothetical protein
MEDVMVLVSTEESVCYGNLSRLQWTDLIEKIIERLFPDLKESNVVIHFENKWFVDKKLENLSGAFEHESQLIYVYPNRLAKSNIMLWFSVLIHELRHFWQLQQGLLSDQIQEQFFRDRFANGVNMNDIPYHERPWEKDALDFEQNHIYEALKIYEDSNYWKKE